MSGRDFRGMKNGVKDSGPGPIKKGKPKKKKGKKKGPPVRPPIQRVMAGDPGDHEYR